MNKWYDKTVNESEMVGETVEFVDVDETKNQIVITTQSGRQFRIYHDQYCCEQVEIAESQDGDGQLVTLVGKKIEGVEVELEEDVDPPPFEDCDSWTRTKISFRTNSETVISRWIGTSNGYYSESITINELNKLFVRKG